MLTLYESLPLDKLHEVLSRIPTKIPMNGEASLEVSQTRSGKTIYTIHGQHYSSEALRLMHEEIRPKAERNPNNWLFLVEGSPTGDIPEVIYGYMLGRKLRIPTENPIKDPYNKEVVERAIESGMKPEDVYLTLSVNMLQVIPNLDQVVNGLSEMWDISPSYLRGLITCLSWESQTNPEFIRKKKEEFKRIRNQIDRISNDLSSQELDKIVGKYQDRNNVFAYLGGNHKEILDRV